MLIFEKHKINYSDFDANPSIINNPLLVIRIKDKYFPWVVAAPMIASLAIFGKPLSAESLKKAPIESKAYFSSIRTWWSKNPENVCVLE